MTGMKFAFAIVLVCCLALMVGFSQDQSGEKSRQEITPSCFEGIGSLSISAEYEVADKTSESAPNLDQLRDTVVKEFEDCELQGSLPAKLVLVMNAFTSKVSGDVVYSLRLELRRKAVVLGTTNTFEVPVRQVGSVGRCNYGDAKNYILTSATELANQLRKEKDSGR